MLLCLSASHQSAPVSLLERLERTLEPEAAIRLALDAEPHRLRGAVALATCNRFELYLDSADLDPTEPDSAPLDFTRSDAPSDRTSAPDAAHRVLRSVAARLGLDAVDADRLGGTFAVFADAAAAEHLFGVASGLESAAIGEGEIAGQVRRAHALARSVGTVTDPLERLFQAAHRTAKEVKHRTGLQQAGRSLVHLSLRLAEQRVVPWPEARVLLIGTGAYAGATVSALRARGVGRITVYSPSGRAPAFAEPRGLEALEATDLTAAIADADLLIACSAVQDPVLTTELLGGAERLPPLLIDLGMPRNIEPAAAGLAGTELLDLELVARHAPLPELSARAEAAEIVGAAAEDFFASQAEREALPTLVSLRSHVLALLEDELCRARRAPGERRRDDRGRDDEAPAPDPDVEAALRRFTGRLLHAPSARIRALGRAGRAEEAAAAAAVLFGVGGE